MSCDNIYCEKINITKKVKFNFGYSILNIFRIKLLYDDKGMVV